MEIKEFVQRVLLDINAAIKEAQLQVNTQNSAYAALISPAYVFVSDLSKPTGYDKLHQIEFDLAVEVEEAASSQAGGGAKLRLFSTVEAGAKISTTTEATASSSHRVKFQVPVRYPLMCPVKPNWNASPEQLQENTHPTQIQRSAKSD